MYSDKNYATFYIKIGLLVFLGCWFLTASLTNFTDFINFLQIASFPRFHSGNFGALKGVFSIYQVPDWATYIIFGLDIAAQVISGLLFILGAFKFWRGESKGWHWINIAFGISMALWCIFAVLEEIFIVYAFEPTQLRLLIFEMVAFMLIHLIPHNEKETP